MTFRYNAAEHSQLQSFIFLIIAPPIHLKMIKRRPPNSLIQLLNHVNLSEMELFGPKIILCPAEGIGLQCTLSQIFLRGKIDKGQGNFNIGWTLSECQAFCHRIHVAAFNGYDIVTVRESLFENEPGFRYTPNDTILTCNVIQYTQDKVLGNETADFCLEIEGFKLLFTKQIELIFHDLLTFDPREFGKKRKKESNPIPPDVPYENVPIVQKSVKPVRKLKYVLLIERPQFNLQNDITNSQMLVIAEQGRVNVYEETLPFDILEVDIKRTIQFRLNSMRTFVAPAMVDLNRPSFWLDTESGQTNEGLLRKVFISTNMTTDILHYRLPFCYTNFATKSEAKNEYLWNDEFRSTKVHIELPELESQLESDQFLIVSDVLSSILFNRAETSEIENFTPPARQREFWRQEELKTFGQSKLEQFLTAKIQKLQWEKNPRLVKEISFEIGRFTLYLMENTDAKLKFDMERLTGSVSFNHGDSGVKEIEIHKIDVEADGQKAVIPLSREEFHENAVMFSFRVKDRFLRGLDSATWQIFQHFELLVHPVEIIVAQSLYKFFYRFFFP